MIAGRKSTPTRIWTPALAMGALLVLSAWSPASNGQPPARPETEPPQVWAMLAGIERYEDSLEFPRCRGAARDAAELARWLIDSAGWPADHVLLLSDRDLESLEFDADANRRPEYRPATKANLDWGARQWLPGKAKPGDTILLFFAGQAVGLPTDPDKPNQRTDRDYLIPVDGRGANIDLTGWRPGEAIADLADQGDFAIVCLFDTSPAGRAQSPRALGDPVQFETGERMLRGVVRWPGVTAWLAAGDQPAGQTDEDGAGFLTQALLNALGTRRAPNNLTTCLETLRREPSLASQRFLASGGFRPDLTLWPADARPQPPKGEPPLLQRGHADRVVALDFNADGRRLYSAGRDSTVRIWSAGDAELQRVLLPSMNGVWSLAKSDDGRLLAAGGGKGEVYLFDLVAESPRLFIGGSPHKGPVERVAFLPEDDREIKEGEAPPRRLVSLDNQGRCVVWDVSERQTRLLTVPADLGGRLLTVAKRPGAAAFCLVAADRTGAEALVAFDATGKRLTTPTPPLAGRAAATALSDDGNRLFLGLEDGSVTEFSLADGRVRSEWRLAGPVSSITVAPLWAVAASDRSLRLLPLDEGAKEPGAELTMDRRIAQVALSADGRLIAAADQFRGDLRVWEVAADGASATPIEIDRKNPGAILSLGFAPGGEALAAGDGAGGIRLWEIPSGRVLPSIAASRGRVRHVAVSDDERALLQIGDDGVALVWELGEGRGVRRVPGSTGFRPTGGFLASGDLALIDRDGNLAVHDRATLARKPLSFERPMTADGRTLSAWGFGQLAIGPEGRVAAASGDGPLACVWDSADGSLVHQPIRDHDDAITALAFSADGRLLLTGSDDARAKVWSLAEDAPKLERVLEPDDPDGASAVTAAAFSPRDSGEIVVGRRDGQINLWRPGAERPVKVGAGLEGMVRSVVFSVDGQLIASGGDDRQISLVEAAKPDAPIVLGSRPSHFEMINSLVFWPKGKILASASDDTTIRLWRLADRKLIGALAASREGLDWVVFTPEGLYDASPEGERRVTWRLDRKLAGAAEDDFVARLEQLRSHRFVFDLAQRLALAEDVAASAPDIPTGKPPRVDLETAELVGSKQRRVDLVIRLNDPMATDLRLYHNGVAIGGDLKPTDRGEIRTTITLVGGENTIYAMAEKPGSVDGRSNQLELTYDGPTPGRTHVLALGISRYSRQALRFADGDAQAIADFLRRSGPGGSTAEVAEPLVLLNEDVSVKAVDDAFEEIRRRVEGRPEDRVVIFMAGHADVRRGRFCLLLPTAEMPEGPALVAMRSVGAGPTAAERPSPTVRDETILPYGLIHQNLSFVEALQRLVIVDACQAEAIFDDPTVRALQRRAVRLLAESDAHKARTSYILASRRGERAGESDRLGHGLLTYSLLRGMGAKDLGPTPDLDFFDQLPTADFNGDGWIETVELRQYADLAVPQLAQAFPELVLRDGDARAAVAEASLARDADQSSSFPLIEAPPIPRRE